MANWSALIPDAPFDWALIPLDGRKRPIDPATGKVMEQWQNQPGYDVDGLSALNGLVLAAGLILGPPSGGVLAVDFDGPDAPGKFQEIFNRPATDLPPTVGVTSGKHCRGQRLFQVDQDWWPHLRGRREWKHNGTTCLELRWAGHQSVIAGAHPETNGYSWLPDSSPADRELALAPDWLLEPLLRSEAHAEPFQPTTDDAKRAIAMLQCISTADRTDYDSWLDVGMALFHTDPGLLAEWVDWSKAMPNFDEAECLAKWESFGTSNGSRLTIRSLHHWAKPGGYKEPKRKTPPKPSAKPVAQPSGVAQGGTSETSGVALAENRKALKQLRELAKVLLQDKVPPHERVALLRAAGQERGFNLRDGEILAMAAEARRALNGKASAATPGDEFDIPDEVWVWDQVIAARTPNLLVALQKVGKTALMAGLISAWHYGTGSFLGHELIGPCPPVIIAGTDQTMADWRSVLAPAGLMQQLPNGKWKLCGPIVKLWHRSQPVYLDMAGNEEIAATCEQHPGALLFCDTYAALTAPLGLDEAKPEAAEPLYNLMEMVEPFGATPVLLHHASKSRANERASNASRNSNAIPAAVSQIISLQWLDPEKKSDQRINLTTEGRNSKPVDLVIEQVERSQWISHGTAEQIRDQQRLSKVEGGLSDRQADTLDLIRDAWERNQELTAPQLAAQMPDHFDSDRKARATLQQLFEKGLADKRIDNDPAAGGTVIKYRPAKPSRGEI